MANSVKVKARQDLVRYKSQLRQQAREREQRIEAAALTVLVQLGRRAEAEAAAGRAIEELHGEGLKIAEIAAWCGGLSAAELNRLRAAARPQPTSPETDATATQGAASGLLGDADAPDAAGAAASHPMSGRDQAGAGADEPVAGPSASGL